ncbi:HNH endonuclease signature motif containing protein [Leptospira licerasiae]|uniref:HNH endonuclease signature motif containing protein n=1 Tax=Leptospira licerasiae TaxID=447106 RepID=UPI00301A37EE
MAWTEQEIQRVWEKGQVALPNNPDEWRKDDCGAWLNRKQYGNRNSDFGWEIDHIRAGGSDSLSNLRPLQWKNNVDKSDGRLKCKVESIGTKNFAKN